MSDTTKTHSETPQVGIIGLSHLGIIWSVGYASLGFDVIGYDSESRAVETLQKGTLPIPEPNLPELFKKAGSHLQFTSDPELLKKCRVVFFARDVPMDEEGQIDLTEINNLLDKTIPYLASGVDFIFMGQVPVGYTRSLGSRIRKYRPELLFSLIYRVETLTIGQAVNDFLKPDRIIVGLEDSSQGLNSRVQAVLHDPFKVPLVIGSYESAELTKSAINVYLANSVTFVNAIADLCEKVGANIHEIVAAMKLDRRFSPYSYWRPGLGFAGGHLERDLMSLSRLAKENGLVPQLLNTIIQSSKGRYRWLVQALEETIFTDHQKPTLSLWGLAYKKGTDSLHNAHCLKVIRDYGERANILAYDPLAKLPSSIQNVRVVSDKFEALRQSDGLIILTEWDEFRINEAEPFLQLMREPVIIDGVNILGPKVKQNSSINYIAMGIPRRSHL